MHCTWCAKFDGQIFIFMMKLRRLEKYVRSDSLTKMNPFVRSTFRSFVLKVQTCRNTLWTTDGARYVCVYIYQLITM